MTVDNYYSFFQQALGNRLCDNIIKHCSKNLEYAKVGGDTVTLERSEGKVVEEKRQSQVAFVDDRWIYKEIQPYVALANEKAGWNFNWDWTEQAQFTEYGLNEHYGWHCDSYSKPYVDVPDGMKGKIRKLSVTVSLTDPEEYEGGDLEFDFRSSHDYEFGKDTNGNKKICEPARARGSVIVFPSFVWHRVKPVTKGVRNSLVMWNLGPPWQ